MKIVIAPDSFKGSLTAQEAAEAIDRGIKRAAPRSATVLMPVADGGEGTMQCLVQATNGRTVEATVANPIGESILASYGVLGDGKTAVIEMASASGLTLIPEHRRNPLATTSYGTGELIKKALGKGYSRFIIAIGGSATNDGGIGMLQALGLRLLDEAGNNVGFGGEMLDRIRDIDDSEWDLRIAECSFIIATDVTNPLIGPLGASHVFGPQKGATPKMAELLDHKMEIWADLVERKKGVRLHDMPGAGAAGGVGGALMAFFPSEARSGAELVLETVKLQEALEGAHLVFTGEGKADAQSSYGKITMAVAQEAQKQGVPVILLAGAIGEGAEQLIQNGVTSFHSIVNEPMTLSEAVERAPQLLAQKTEQILYTILAGTQIPRA